MVASIIVSLFGLNYKHDAFIGSNYLAQALRKGDTNAQKEKVHHDNPLVAYQVAYTKYTHNRTKLDWIAKNLQIHVK